MIDFMAERIRTIPEAARRLPRRRGGRPVHPSTLYRWINRGVRGIHLESLRTPSGLVTSDEAVRRFVQRLSGHDPNEQPRSASARNRDDQRAEEELRGLGL